MMAPRVRHEYLVRRFALRVAGGEDVMIIATTEEIAGYRIVRTPALKEPGDGTEGPDQRMRTWKAIMAKMESVTMIATRLPDASSRASGTSSEKTIQIMAPEA